VNLSRNFRWILRIDSAASPFGEVEDAIGRGGRIEELGGSVGPADLDGVEVGLGTEAEVEAKVAGGVVAGAGADLVYPDAIGTAEGDAGSDGGAVGGGADEVDTEPMVLVAGEIDEEHRRVGEVIDDGRDAAVVEEVGCGEAAS
jgi:hypothetical protein